MKSTFGGRCRALILLAAPAAALACASAANASSCAVSAGVDDCQISVGDGWNSFYFGGAPSSWVDSTNIDTMEFTFQLSAPAIFKVTDGFLDGDQFSFSVSGSLGSPYTTPLVPADGTYVGNNWDLASTSSSFSHLFVNLVAGPLYTVTGTVITSPNIDASTGLPVFSQGAVELVATTPLPATWALLLTGLLGIAFAARGRSKRGGTSAAVA